MLTVFLAGRGHYLKGRSRYAIEAGMVGMVWGTNPGILLSESSDPYDHLYCRFSGRYAREMARGIRRDRGGSFFFHDRFEQVAGLLRRISPLKRESLPSQMGNPELVLAEALIVLSESPKPQRGQTLTAESLRQYLSDNISHPFDLAEVAEHFGLSRASLCRATRRVTGRTVLDIAEELKIEWAETLMTSGAVNVGEAARRVGYADPFYFSRVFRKRTGSTPSGYVRRKPL